MDFILDILNTTSGWMREYMSAICLSMIATLLTIFGNDINLLIKKQIGSLQFFLRVTLFVIFCAFGFAFLTSFLSPLLVNFLSGLDDIWVTICVIGIFYLIGIIAQKKGMI